jgi:diamine N-acetyltransferase
MIIHELIQTDIPALARLAQKTYILAFGQTMTKEELQDVLKLRSEDYFRSNINKDTILVAYEKKKLLGFIQFGKADYDSIETTDKDIKLDKIYVDSNNQGKGIGKQLMDAMLTHKRLEGIENIYLDVFGANQKAFKLYEKYGFKVIGKIPFKVNGKIIGYDLLMKKEKINK